jgi:processive 1,2-diacylglycerol beta-glucosyltransferase
MIISVFPTCAQFVSHYKEKQNPSIKTVTVITDVVTGWEWINENTDMYCVPALDVKNGLVEKGISPRQVFVTGVPVREAFDSEHKGNRRFKNVLMMGSTMGKLTFSQKTLDTLGELPYGFTVVTGKNIDLYNKLSSMKIPQNIHLIGYTRNIPEIMKRSDLIITKPGGATIFEAIESNLPMLIQPSKVGQEMFNIEFINKYGLGDTFNSQSEMIFKIEDILREDGKFSSIISNMNDFKASTQKQEAYIQMAEWINATKVGVTS